MSRVECTHNGPTSAHFIAERNLYFLYEGEARAEKRPPPLSMCEETTEAQQSKTEAHTKEEKTPLKVASMLVTRHRVLSGEKSRPTSLNPQKVPRASLG